MKALESSIDDGASAILNTSVSMETLTGPEDQNDPEENQINRIANIITISKSVINLIDVLDHEIAVLLHREEPSTRLNNTKRSMRRWKTCLNLTETTTPVLLARLFTISSHLMRDTKDWSYIVNPSIKLAHRIWASDLDREISQEALGMGPPLDKYPADRAYAFCAVPAVPCIQLLSDMSEKRNASTDDTLRMLREIFIQSFLEPAHQEFLITINNPSTLSTDLPISTDRSSTSKLHDSLCGALQRSGSGNLPRVLGHVLELAVEVELCDGRQSIESSCWLAEMYERLLQINLRSLSSSSVVHHVHQHSPTSQHQWQQLRIEPKFDKYAQLIRTTSCQRLCQEVNYEDLGAVLSYCAMIYHTDLAAALVGNEFGDGETSLGSLSGRQIILLSVLRRLRDLSLASILALMSETLSLWKDGSSITSDDQGVLYTVLHFLIMCLPSHVGTDQREELRATSKDALQALINRLKTACPIADCCLIYQSVIILIRDRRYATNQASLEDLTGAMATQLQSPKWSSVKLDLITAGVAYVQACKVVHRLALSYLYHMNGSLVSLVSLVVILQRVLFSLSSNLQARGAFPTEQHRKNSANAIVIRGARAFGNILVLLSDPPTPQVRRPYVKAGAEKKSNHMDLVSLQDQARQQSQRYLPPVLMHYVKEEHSNPLRAEEKEALAPGMNSLLKCLKSETSTVFAALREGERDLLAIMLTQWKKRG